MTPYHPKDYRAIDDSFEEENVMTPGWFLVAVLICGMVFGCMYLQHQYDLKYNAKRARPQETLRALPASQGIVIRP